MKKSFWFRSVVFFFKRNKYMENVDGGRVFYIGSVGKEMGRLGGWTKGGFVYIGPWEEGSPSEQYTGGTQQIGLYKYFYILYIVFLCCYLSLNKEICSVFTLVRCMAFAENTGSGPLLVLQLLFYRKLLLLFGRLITDRKCCCHY